MFVIVFARWEHNLKWAIIFKILSDPWIVSIEGMPMQSLDFGPTRMAFGNVLGRDRCWQRALRAGALTWWHSIWFREAHRRGYDTLGRKTVLYRSIAPYFESLQRSREEQNLLALIMRVRSWCESDSVHDLSVPRYFVAE